MIQSVDRAVTLLAEVAAHGAWVGVRELARSAGLKVPTAQNLLKTLAARGLLDFGLFARSVLIDFVSLAMILSARSTLAAMISGDSQCFSRLYRPSVSRADPREMSKKRMNSVRPSRPNPSSKYSWTATTAQRPLRCTTIWPI